MKTILANLAMLAVLSASPVLAQPQRPAPPPPTGIDNAIVRLNGCDVITQHVLPCLIESAGLNHMAFPSTTLYSQTRNASVGPFQVGPVRFGPYTVQVRVRSDLQSVNLVLPFDEESLFAQFRTGAGGAGRIVSDLDLPDATLDARVAVQVRFAGSAGISIPSVVMGMVQNAVRIDTFADIHAAGLSGQFGLDFARSGAPARLNITSISPYQVQVGSVNIRYGPVTLSSVAGMVSINPGALLGRPTLNTIDAAATALGNYYVGQNAVRDMLRGQANLALGSLTQMSGYSQQLPPIDGIPLNIAAVLQSFSTRINDLKTSWQMNVTSSGASVAPGLSYTYEARADQNIDATPAAGDIQAFIPLSLLDKAGYELARRGMFSRTVTIPAIPMPFPPYQVQPGLMHVQPAGLPRTSIVPGSTDELRWIIPLHITGQAGPLYGTDFSGNFELDFRMQIDERNGLRLTWTGFDADSLAGTVRLYGYQFSLNYLESLGLIPFMGQYILAGQPFTTVIPQVLPDIPCATLNLQEVSVGSKYVNLAINVE